MARSRKVWRRVALSAVAVLCSGGLLWFLRSLVRGPRERAQFFLDVAGVLISLAGVVASVVIPVVQQRRTPGSQAINDKERLNRAAETLARAVRIKWEREAGMRALLNPEPMRLRWSMTRRRQRLHGNFEQIGKQFSTLPFGRLVVLGKPGLARR